jgi:ferritin-like metal-binding protein YciE
MSTKLLTPKQVSTLEQVFIDQIRDIYSCEIQIAKALPKMARAATSPALKKGFQFHLEQTEQHIQRIKTICHALDVTPTGKKCGATAGLLEEGQESMNEEAAPSIKDVMLIGAARRIEHYEMAAYTGACDLARVLDFTDALKLLSTTLSEEVATDGRLAKLCAPLLAAAQAPED